MKLNEWYAVPLVKCLIIILIEMGRVDRMCPFYVSPLVGLSFGVSFCLKGGVNNNMNLDEMLIKYLIRVFNEDVYHETEINSTPLEGIYIYDVV